jgi:hypothetical protein
MIHHTRCTIAIAVAAACLLASSSVARAGTVYEVNTTGATQTGSKNNSGVYIGQAFNSGTNTLLTTASLQINREGLATADFTLNLHLTTGSANAYFKDGNSLAAVTFSNSILSTSTGAFHQFTNLNWTLTPNTVYMIGIGSESAATVKWTLNQSGTQDTSTGFITGYAGYNAQEGTNVDNGRHGATITAVPEPSTVVALGVAATCLVAALRRRLTLGSGQVGVETSTP